MIQLLQLFANECKPQGFFGFPTWYKYLEAKQDVVTKQCEVQFTLMKNNTFNGSDVLLIGLGVIDIMVRLAALIAVGFVMYGGIRYITSQGSPDATKSAQNTILTALIGLVIAIIAAVVVTFLGRAVQ